MRAYRAHLRLVVILFLAVGSALAQGNSEAATARCLQLLDEADHAAADAKQQRAAELYPKAFKACEQTDLPLHLQARVAERRGDYFKNYGNDLAAAIATYEDALRRVTMAGGLDHPARIPLLQGLSNALSSALAAGVSDSPARDSQRLIDLAEEAQRVRLEAYGPTSREASEGHVWLSVIYEEDQPALAEDHARKALEIRKQLDGLHSRSVWEALVALEQALRAQGLAQEADEVSELASEIGWNLRSKQDG